MVALGDDGLLVVASRPDCGAAYIFAPLFFEREQVARNATISKYAMDAWLDGQNPADRANRAKRTEREIALQAILSAVEGRWRFSGMSTHKKSQREFARKC